MFLVLGVMMLQAAYPLLVWRWMRRRGWSKRIIFLAALPIPALALARSAYLFAGVERLANGELASVADELRLTAAFAFAVAAGVLYLTGIGTAWFAGGNALVRPRTETLKDVFK